MEGNDAVAAKIAVWWDMNDCPIPESYDARRVRPSIERAFKTRGYSDPVSITAYGDQTQTPGHLLRGLSSTGIAVAHAKSKSTCSHMFSDMVEWRARNPPPATMMLISNQVKDGFSWDLARLQQQTKYDLFLAFSTTCHVEGVLKNEAKWSWKKLLGFADNEHEEEIICGETSPMFYCKSCNFDSKILAKFRNHLSSKRHALEEIMYPSHPQELDPVTRMWGKNYTAKPEYATAKIAVWWNMSDCPIPEGYDPRQVRPSLEAAFKHLGYSGPVSITAFGDLTQTPDQILQRLSSTGVDVAHTNSRKTLTGMFSDLRLWQLDNPPPATIMVISDDLEDGLSTTFTVSQQKHPKYNLFMAYSYRPYKMSVVVTSAEWLWESLLVGHHPETRKHDLQKCSGKGQSTRMFYCRTCFCDFKILDGFRKHLSSNEHAAKEARINVFVQFRESERRRSFEEAYFPRSKRLRKARKSLKSTSKKIDEIVTDEVTTRTTVYPTAT